MRLRLSVSMRSRSLALLLGALCLSSCGDDTDPIGTTPDVATVEVTPSEVSVEVGGTAEFDAVARDGDNNVVSGAAVTWRSSDGTVANVDTNGTATGIAQGTATIIAEVGVVSDSAALTVTGPAEPAALAISSGDGQYGKTGQEFSDLLVVQVTNDAGGPAAGVTVGWTVTEGAGTLSSSTSVTDAQGEATVTVTGGETTGDIVVQAEVTDGMIDSVTFTLHTSVAAVQIVDLAFVDTQGRTNQSFLQQIQVGDTIEWTYVPQGSTIHTVTSSSVPEGGASFDSGTMSPGATFRFAPQVEGTWTFLCQTHPTIMNGATIEVTAASAPAAASSALGRS